jgi:hypothetical protein
MSQRGAFSFYPVNSTEPAFNSTGTGTSAFFAFESSDTNRVWQGPSGRAVRLSSKAADDYSVVFGTTTAVATSSGGILILGGTVETFRANPGQTHIAIVSSTDVTVNVTLGYGM